MQWTAVSVLLAAFVGSVVGTPGQLPALYEKYYDLYQLQNPSGSYSGCKTVLGQHICIDTVFESDTELSFTASGPIAVSCKSEAYTLSGNNIDLTNLGSPDDCVAKALAAADAEVESITYDPSSDTVTCALKYSILTIKITLDHVAAAPLRSIESPVKMKDVMMMLPVFLKHSPSGVYTGSKSVLGQTVKASIQIDSATDMEMKISGVISLDCANEAYAVDASGKVNIPGADKSGDCIHDAMADNHVTLKGVTYDGTADHITVNVKYLFLTITLELDHSSLLRSAHAPMLYSVVDELYPMYALNTPAGEYDGGKSVLGQQVKVQLTLNPDTSMLDFVVSGVISLSCKGEAYTYSNGVISLKNIGAKDDCVHMALSKNGCSLKEIDYVASSDEVKVAIKGPLGIPINLELAHHASTAMAVYRTVVVSSNMPSLVDLVRVALPFAYTHDPAGTYHGSKSILGQKVDTTVTVTGSSFALKITGGFHVDCKTEDYSYANGVISITHVGEKGDCVHDALDANRSTLKSVEYDPASDIITLNVKVSIVPVSVELKHQ